MRSACALTPTSSLCITMHEIKNPVLPKGGVLRLYTLRCNMIQSLGTLIPGRSRGHSTPVYSRPLKSNT